MTCSSRSARSPPSYGLHWKIYSVAREHAAAAGACIGALAQPIERNLEQKQNRIPGNRQKWPASWFNRLRWQPGRRLCQLTPRDELPWLDRTWRLKRVDDLPVWSLSCFYIRIGYRRKGVTAALIDAALKAAKRAKAPALEAYPLDASKTPSASSTGFVTTFARARFKTVACHTAPRPIMRHDLKNIQPAR
jgi:GNAT superfamily N-acetyltransferase